MHYVRLQWAEFEGQLVNLHNADAHVRTVPAIAVIDAKSIYDTLTRRIAAQSLVEKRTAIELLAYMQDVKRNGTETRGVHGEANIADCLTKQGSYQQMLEFMRTFEWQITDDPEALSAKKRQQLKLGRFEQKTSEDVDEDNFLSLLARAISNNWPEMIVEEDEEPEWFDLANFSAA